MACWNCQRRGHKKANCPLIQCFRCDQFGHMSWGCPNKSYYRNAYDNDRDFNHQDEYEEDWDQPDPDDYDNESYSYDSEYSDYDEEEFQETHHTTFCQALEWNEYEKLPSSVTEGIEETAAKKGISLKKEADKKGTWKLLVQGQEENVQDIADLIKDKIREDRKRHTTHSLPVYWQLSMTYSSIPDAVNGTLARKKKFYSCDTSADERKDIEKLLQRTWKPEIVGFGKDAQNLTHSEVQLVEVKRIENPEMWENYSERREKLLRRLKQTAQERLAKLRKIPHSTGSVLTTHTLSSESVLRRDMHPEVNEHYLFHGTKEEYVEAIARDGLDNRCSSEQPLLGRGIYAAESSTKADQYTDSKLARSGGLKTMLLVRMLLGEPHINNSRHPPKFERPPCKSCLKTRCTCPHVSHFDSVVDDAGRLFREFVVYEQCQCYPEYLITYRRV